MIGHVVVESGGRGADTGADAGGVEVEKGRCWWWKWCCCCCFVY